MSNTIAINLPDIGDFDTVEVIEVLVKSGQVLKAEDSIVTLESDKASMEIPCPQAGVVKEVHIDLGDTISQGSLLITLETSTQETSTEATQEVSTEAKQDKTSEKTTQDTPTNTEANSTQTLSIVVPDIGDVETVEVIEVLVAAGDELAAEDSIITLESDKASMEIPCPNAGKVASLSVAVGDKIKQGDEILQLTTQVTTAQAIATQAIAIQTTSKSADIAENLPETPKVQTSNPASQSASQSNHQAVVNVTPQAEFHASPGIRKLARELGIDLGHVKGTGTSGRITGSDVKGFVKTALTTLASSNVGASGLPPMPSADYAKFGEVETLELSRINKLSGKHLHACWLNIPHVTQFDEVNINDLEDFRQSQKAKGIKLTPLVFIMKAVAVALADNPRFNSSMASDNQSLVLKKYINLGIAVDTPNGLMVPVIKDVPNKSIAQLMADLIDVSARAREGKLSAGDLQGGTFTISSLGGIGGTQFTPIINAPEVAILGVSRSSVKPIWNGSDFEPQLMLPLALSYDHRVIDGAQGARFITQLNALLSDIRGLL